MGMSVEYKLENQSRVNLGDLRELVEATKDWPADTPVHVTKSGGSSQLDPATVTIRVKLR